ncbi:MAG: cyanophycinase [Bacteroidales bacterium]|nr:cyanophycinase [Bacteroidales bacterium]
MAYHGKHRFPCFFYILLLICLSIGNLNAQPGRILLVGGGAEKNGQQSWSTPAYTWAGENRRIAVIGTSSGSLANYFLTQCGASIAREFVITSRDSANSQATYDTLVSYDVIFFRGGDQYNYYRYYKDTKMLEAVIQVYNNGGTICGTSAGMHILSQVIFTAKNGSAYPDECIENPGNPYVTLADDFLQFFPGFLFDTHFAERGRFGRLTGFLANYFFGKGLKITGIGMDDMTCMTIDETGLGTVYGTGCANFYLPGTDFKQNGTKLLTDSLKVVQLLHGCTYHFSTGEFGFTSLDQTIITGEMQETGNYTMFASGSDLLSDNTGMLAGLVQRAGKPSDPILLLSGDPEITAGFRQKLLELGSGPTEMFTPGADLGTDTSLRRAITEAVKILFLRNSLQDIAAFLETPNGALLNSRLHSDGMISAFAGDNARFAGKTVVDNYLTEYASWYGEMDFLPGLSLLRHTVIMPNTYLTSDIYENTVTAVPYAMLKDTLRYGIWLTDHSYLKYAPVEGIAVLTGYGTAPVMVVANSGIKGGFSSHTSTGSTSVDPRMVAGFENLTLTLTDETNPYRMGRVAPSGEDAPDILSGWLVYPNPSTERITVSGPLSSFRWEITGMEGRVLMQGMSPWQKATFSITDFSPSCYILKVFRETGEAVYHTVVIRN